MTFRLILVVASGGFACGEADSHEPILPSTPNRIMNFSARKICCLERATPCMDANDTCDGCDQRCLGGCADGAPLLDCLERTESALACLPDGTVGPADEPCRQAFDEYQTAARSCGPAACAVGGAALAGGRAGVGGSR